MIMHNFNIEEERGYNKIWCGDGHYITSYNEGDDISEFSSFKIAYCPINADLTIYHCITDEENERLVKLQEEYELALMKEETNEHN